MLVQNPNTKFSERGDEMPTEITEAIVETTQAVEETTVPVTELMEEPTAAVTDPVEDLSNLEVIEDNEISETVGFVPTEEYVLEMGSETVQETVAVVTIDIIETASSNIAHASLFGSFLVCGTLVGIFLLRGRYGS